jgi:excisionase family DNA binding protein
MERLMTTEEVAELLRIDVVTVRRQVMRGELTAYRIAGEFRFAPTDVEKFLEHQKVVVNVPKENQFGDKFTKRARKVLGLATEEARKYSHPFVSPEHILLALLVEGEGLAAQALSRLQVELSVVRAQVEEVHPAEPLTEETAKRDAMIGVDALGKQTIELGVKEAQALGHHYLGTEHFLLGLLQQENTIAAQILQNTNVGYEETRELIKQLLVEKK